MLTHSQERQAGLKGDKMARLMTVEEVARYLRVTERTIYRLIKGHKIPAIKVGHQWRFEKASIDEWLRQNVIEKHVEVLVIDDEELIRLLFEETLGKLGYKVVIAKNGSEGLELIKQRDFDLLFLDLKMPGMDGAEIFRQVKTIKPNLPVVIITGYPNSDMMDRALAHGPFGIMKKPFTDVDIITAANSFLQSDKDKGNRRLWSRYKL